MILNQFLPIEKLQKTLSKNQFKQLEFILQGLDPNKKIPILENYEALGKIHHALQIDQYKNKNARVDLLIHAEPHLRQKYFAECNFPDPSGMDATELLNHINKICKFEWGNNRKTDIFIKRFNYPNYLIPKDSFDTNTEEVVFGNKKTNLFEPLKLLLDYQAKITYRALEKLEKQNARFLIQMPTGTGKTRTAMDIITRYINQKKTQQVIWLAHSSELLSQAIDAFKHVWNHAGQFPINIYRLWGNFSPMSIKKHSVIFAGYAKLSNYIKNNSLQPDMVVIDEAHKILAPTYEKLLYTITSEKNSKVFGLTATPGRGIDQEQNDKLAMTFHNDLLGIELNKKDEEMYEENIVECFEDKGILAKVNLEPLITRCEYPLTKEEWIKIATNMYDGDYKEFDPKMLKNLAEDSKRNILIVNTIRTYAQKKKKILYFSTNLEQSRIVTAALTNLGINAIHIDANTDKAFRKEIVQKFKTSNEINVICNFDIFSTGFDVPNLDVIFIGRPINSPVLFNQMVGRGTRGLKMGGKEYFTLIQVIDQIFDNDFDPYKNYSQWDNTWKNNLE